MASSGFDSRDWQRVVDIRLRHAAGARRIAELVIKVLRCPKLRSGQWFLSPHSP
jgi:hypothetical protein